MTDMVYNVAYKCVVGNCRQSEDMVKRRYFAGYGYVPNEDCAYLDLCWFHVPFFNEFKELEP